MKGSYQAEDLRAVSRQLKEAFDSTAPTSNTVVADGHGNVASVIQSLFNHNDFVTIR